MEPFYHDSSQFGMPEIERYHKGDMTPAERNALEKAALDDPFLADALEGYAFTNSAGADVELLEKKLKKKSERQPVIVPIARKWIAAAVILIVAGSAYFIFTKKTIPENLAEQPQTVHFPAAKNNEDKVNIPEVSSNTAADSIGYVFQKPATALIRKKNKGRTEERIKNTKAADTEVSAIASSNAVQEETSRKEAAQFNRMHVDSVSAVPSTSMASKPEVQGNLHIVMKKTSEPEVAVIVLSRNEVKKAHLSPGFRTDSLEPLTGWNYYNNYLANEMDIPEKLQVKPGILELSFDIDKEGSPQNITVDKSLCEACDQQAVELLRNGPKWKQKKGRKNKLRIIYQ